MILPIVRRELQVQARARGALYFRVGAAVVGVCIAAFFFGLSSAATTPRSAGRSIFQLLSWLSFIYCLFEGPRSAAGCLSDEKKSGTLGLLFLTDLRTYDIVLGKLSATCLNSFYGLIGCFPPLALPLLLGGVTGGEFWRVSLVLTDTLLLSFCLSICVSAWVRRPESSLASSLVLLGLLLFLSPFLKMVVPTTALNFSPWQAFRASADLAYRAAPAEYWMSLGQILFLAMLLLLLSGVFLKRYWNVEPQSGAIDSLARHVRPPAWYLEKNPIQWLVVRNSRSAWWSRVVAGGVVVVGLGLLVTRPPALLMGGNLLKNFFWVAIAIHFVLSLWVAIFATQVLSRERQSGNLEILLCSPLSNPRVVDGFFLGIRWIFGLPIMIILCVEVAVFVYAYNQAFPRMSGGFLFISFLFSGFLISDYYALAWYGLWSGLRTRTQGSAAAKTILFVLIIPLFFYPWCFVFGIVGALVKNFAFMSYARGFLDEELRQRASDVDSDPRRRAQLDRSRLPQMVDSTSSRAG